MHQGKMLTGEREHGAESTDTQCKYTSLFDLFLFLFLQNLYPNDDDCWPVKETVIVGLGSPTAGWALSQCKPDADERGPAEVAFCSIKYKLARIPKLVSLSTGRSISSSFAALQRFIEFDSRDCSVRCILSYSRPEPGVFSVAPVNRRHPPPPPVPLLASICLCCAFGRYLPHHVLL